MKVASIDPVVQAALNGDRDHPATPRTPRELAGEACAAVRAGAPSLHLHPFDADGRQTLAARPTVAAIRAVRAACPGVPISLTTSASVEPDGIASWSVNSRAAVRGRGIRTGLEDTPVLPDGRPAAGNAELVAAAVSLLAEVRR